MLFKKKNICRIYDATFDRDRNFKNIFSSTTSVLKYSNLVLDEIYPFIRFIGLGCVLSSPTLLYFVTEGVLHSPFENFYRLKFISIKQSQLSRRNFYCKIRGSNKLSQDARYFLRFKNKLIFTHPVYTNVKQKKE